MYIDIYMMYNIWFSVWLSTIITCTCSFSLVYHLYTSCIHQWLHNSSNLKLFGGEGGFYPTCLLLKIMLASAILVLNIWLSMLYMKIWNNLIDLLLKMTAFIQWRYEHNIEDWSKSLSVVYRVLWWM